MLRSRSALVVGLLSLLAAGAIAFVWLGLPVGGEERYDGPPPMTAVIVDQLQLTSPDEAFVDDATRTLRAAGYAVDYVPGEQVTVDYYRELPSKGYGLILIRAHSGFVLRDPQPASDTRVSGDTFLFTSEPYSDDTHAEDQESRRLSVAYYVDTGLESLDADELLRAFQTEPRYFGIKPGFIQSSTRGRFRNSTVVLMGCNGLTTDSLAKAFVRKGARAVVGWDEAVTAGHTDDATELLLGHLLGEKVSTREAVAGTAAEVGPDPTYGGKLTLYE